MKLTNLFALTILAVSATSALASTVTYSGIQDIVLQGVPNTTQTLDIELLGIAAPSDTLRLQITDDPTAGDPYGAGILVLPGSAEVAIPYATYPQALALHLGDPFPTNPQVGSASINLYGFGFPTIEGDFYYPLVSESSTLTGWIQLQFNNTNSSNESITVVDWAVTTDPNLRLAMGQMAAAPEPASWLLTGSAAAAGLLSRLRYLRGKRFLRKG